MAKRDFDHYLVQVQLQYLEMKQDLADFEEAFRDGFITEDKLTEVKITVAQLEANYQRLLYVDYLLEQPKTKVRKKWFRRKPVNQKLENYFDEHNATSEKVIGENQTLLDQLRQHLNELTTADKA